MSEEAKLKSHSNCLQRLLFDSPEVKEVEEKLDQIVDIADSLLKLLIDKESGYTSFGYIIRYDKDVLPFIDKYSNKEKVRIINEALKQYFEIQESIK
ncbi:hypothetical protein [Halalkalibacterium halodurans]|uniref:hypothetical protein n=1 Tax=Halalkalibacterium halodurans TaxID=86665 RepID=UPI0010FCF330|nr:hypothetical protein [Halalkalibacterium halodurans]